MKENIKQSSFILACRGQKTNHTPIWLMRQIGRYMQEYRSVREKVSFLELCKSPELVCEVTTTAVRKINVDAAIIFADILLIVEPLGFKLSFDQGHGPQINPTYTQIKDLDSKLPPVQLAQALSYVGKAISLVKSELKTIPVIGFAGAPFTVASYMIEGKGSKSFDNTKKLMEQNPKAFSHLLNTLSESTIEYLSMQIDHGADAIQLFDSWIGAISERQYVTHVQAHVTNIIEQIKKRHPEIPVIYFGVNTSHLIEQMNQTKPDVLGVDFHLDISKVWDHLKCKSVQGNLDPIFLLCDKDVLKKETLRILQSVHGKPGHIFNLGHGILPQTPVQNVQYLVELVHQFHNP